MQPDQMTVVLTGACGGIGRELASQLAQAGASLYLTGRDTRVLAGMQDKFRRQAVDGQVIFAEAVELMDDDQLDDWVDSILQREKAVNVLVNNAGIARFDLFENLVALDIEQMMYLNSIVPMKLTRKLLPSMKRLKQARVVNVASTFGAIGFPGYSVYSASKYALRGFSQALARELSDTRISVGCFLPRATKTSINTSSVVELNRKLNVAMDPPDLVAAKLLKFLSSNKGELALGWPEKLLVPLNSLFPALIGNAISKKLPIIKQYAA